MPAGERMRPGAAGGGAGRQRRARRLAAASCALAALGFALLSALALGGATDGLDRAALLALRAPGDLGDALGPAWIEEFLTDATALGGKPVLGVLGLVAAGYLALVRAWRALAFLLASLVGGLFISDVFKDLFERARPEFLPHLAREASPSFPSGHATYAAIFYLTFCLLALPAVPRRTRAYLAGAAALLTLLVGFTRVYLGVHYPSDVLAGFLLGAAWTLGCWLLTGAGSRADPATRGPPER